MREAVFHTTPCREPTTTASARIARYLSNKLNAPLYDDVVPTEYYDRVFYVNSVGAFCSSEFRLALADQVRHAKQVIYIQNDYTIHPISQTQKVFRDERGWAHRVPFTTACPILWTTVPANMSKSTDSYVNFNCLTYRKTLLQLAYRYSGVVYWGAYRLDRKPSFDRYFNQYKYPVHFLCHSKIFKKFLGAAWDEVEFIQHPAWKYPEELASYEATVYIEDEAQHGEFHSMANRFYEALGAGVAIFVDKRAVATFEKTGLYVSPHWIVDSASDVAERLPQSRMIAQSQQELWDVQFDTILENEIKQAYRKL